MQPSAESKRRMFKALFVDGSFLFHCIKGLAVRIDYKKLKDLFLTPDDNLISASYYTALPNEYDLEDKHKSFLRILKKEVRIKIRSVPLLKSYDNNHQQSPLVHAFPQVTGRYSKGEDILLACDMVRGAALNYFDCAILISGDGDFVPAVNMLQELGKYVIVASFRSALSHALELEANEVVYLDDVMDRIKFDDPLPMKD